MYVSEAVLSGEETGLKGKKAQGQPHATPSRSELFLCENG